MVDDTVAVHEDFVSGTMDPVGIFRVAIIQGQILPTAAHTGPRQPDPIDNAEIDQSTAPNNTVAINVVLIFLEAGHPWSAGCQYATAQDLPKLDQVVRGANDTNLLSTVCN